MSSMIAPQTCWKYLILNQMHNFKQVCLQLKISIPKVDGNLKPLNDGSKLDMYIRVDVKVLGEANNPITIVITIKPFDSRTVRVLKGALISVDLQGTQLLKKDY